MAAHIPSPSMGHLIPMAEFAKRLVRNHNFTVTLIIPTNSPPSKAYGACLGLGAYNKKRDVNDQRRIGPEEYCFYIY